MADFARKVVTRTVTLSDLSPSELASIFAGWDSKQQAEFFSALRVETQDWPGTGWCMQALHIADALDEDGLFVAHRFADHVMARVERGGMPL